MFKSFTAKNMALRMIGAIIFAAPALITPHVTNVICARAPQIVAPPKALLPDESTGIDGVARALVAAFDQADVVALGEAHQRKLDSDLRIALVCNPDFANLNILQLAQGAIHGVEAMPATHAVNVQRGISHWSLRQKVVRYAPNNG